MEEILYFKDQMPNWIRHLIKGVKPKDPVVVLKRRDDDMILIHHEQSGYEGWMNSDNFTDNESEIIIEKPKKIVWD